MQLSNHRTRRRSSTRNNRGVSLIEVLISILLAAIGLLALAGTNVASIRYTKMSQYRGTATLLAADIGERMRANKAGLASYAVTDDFNAQASAPVANTTCETYTVVACTPAILAAYDLATWRLLVRNQLPEGSVFITPNALHSAADVWLAWRDPAVADSLDAPVAQLECPNGLNTGAEPSVRCSYFRINL
jgi:type IV pilus assembly protein PilV